MAVWNQSCCGLMNGLEGQWGIQGWNRKFVVAAVFGDHLHHGWEAIQGIKRKEPVRWVSCRHYLSPRKHQFAKKFLPGSSRQSQLLLGATVTNCEGIMRSSIWRCNLLILS